MEDETLLPQFIDGMVEMYDEFGIIVSLLIVFLILFVSGFGLFLIYFMIRYYVVPILTSIGIPLDKFNNWLEWVRWRFYKSRQDKTNYEESKAALLKKLNDSEEKKI